MWFVFWIQCPASSMNGEDAASCHGVMSSGQKIRQGVTDKTSEDRDKSQQRTEVQQQNQRYKKFNPLVLLASLNWSHVAFLAGDSILKQTGWLLLWCSLSLRWAADPACEFGAGGNGPSALGSGWYKSRGSGVPGGGLNNLHKGVKGLMRQLQPQPMKMKSLHTLLTPSHIFRCLGWEILLLIIIILKPLFLKEGAHQFLLPARWQSTSKHLSKNQTITLWAHDTVHPCPPHSAPDPAAPYHRGSRPGWTGRCSKVKPRARRPSPAALSQREGLTRGSALIHANGALTILNTYIKHKLSALKLQNNSSIVSKLNSKQFTWRHEHENQGQIKV